MFLILFRKQSVIVIRTSSFLETHSVIHTGAKVNVHGPAESRFQQRQSDSMPVNCDGSIHMLIISFIKKRKKGKRKKTWFSKKQHTTQALARKQRIRWSKQKLHTRNYSLMYLTQLHVSWIIRQRLDNPDRNPFHSLSHPPQILILQYHFRSIRGLRRVSDSQVLLSTQRAKGI